MIKDVNELRIIAENAYRDAKEAIDPYDYKALSAVNRMNAVNVILLKRVEELERSLSLMKRLP